MGVARAVIVAETVIAIEVVVVAACSNSSKVTLDSKAAANRLADCENDNGGDVPILSYISYTLIFVMFFSSTLLLYCWYCNNHHL